MTIQPGDRFRSADTMTDDNFIGTEILIATVDGTGCMGFVYNKKFHRPLNELVEFRQSKPFPLFVGGPVDQEHLFFIHQRKDLISGGQEISDGLVLGGEFRQAIDAINTGRVNNSNIKIFIGYCGWDFGELEEEIAEGSWIKLPGDGNPVF